MSDPPAVRDGLMDRAGAPPAELRRVIIVSGLSGAGKTSALKALEDIGYEAVDNLPLSLVGDLVQPSGAVQVPLALGVDIRTRGFQVEPFLAWMDSARNGDGLDVRLLFLDCDDEVLRRRFTATRRRHPLATDRPVIDGIEHERSLMSPLRGRADVVIDTSSHTLGDLRGQLHGHFGLHRQPGFAVFVTSFSYAYGLPREADLVFDVRFLANPHYDPRLTGLTGMDREVGVFIAADSNYGPFLERLCGLLEGLLPAYDLEGKSYLTIAVGCTGGRHRSVFVVESLAEWLAGNGQRVSIQHRDVVRPT